MLEPISPPHRRGLDAPEADIETRAVIEVLAVLHGRIESALAGGLSIGETQLPELVGRMMHGTAEVWRNVGKRALGEAETQLADIAVDAILALAACRRAPHS